MCSFDRQNLPFAIIQYPGQKGKNKKTENNAEKRYRGGNAAPVGVFDCGLLTQHLVEQIHITAGGNIPAEVLAHFVLLQSLEAFGIVVV